MLIFARVVEMLPGNVIVPNALRYDVAIVEIFAVEIEANVVEIELAVSNEATLTSVKLLTSAVLIVE